MNKKVKFGIIGFGNIGKRHGQHILANSESELIAVCDTNIESMKALPPSVARYEQVAEFLKTDVDVVCVCTPNYLHAPHTIAALNAGKHVVCEKPMALSSKDCDDMIAAEQHSGKTIFAVKQNRYNPPVQQVKQLLEQDGLGHIYLVQVNCFWNRGDAYYAHSDWRGKKEKDGGCLFTQFSHFVDILYYLNGPITGGHGMMYDFAHKHNTEFEDSGSLVLTAENGSLVNFNFTTAAYEKNMEGAITLFGSKGVVKIGGQYLNTIEYQLIKNTTIPEVNITAKANDYGLYQGSMSNHDEVIKNVVEVLRHQGRVMTSSQEGKAVIEMIEKMYAVSENKNP